MGQFSSTQARILVIGPAWVGDMVMAQTFLACLKNNHPEAQIDVLAPPWTRPLLARMPEVTGIIETPFGHGGLKLRDRYQLAKQFRANQYDQAITLRNAWKTALVPFLAGIPKRTGWLGEQRWGLLNDVRRLDKARYPLMVQRFAALAWPKDRELPSKLPRPTLCIDPDQREAALTQHQLKRERPILAVCPGAEFGPSKQWPENYYADVIRERVEEGWDAWIFGSKNDQPVALKIQQQVGSVHCISLAGQTSLATAIDLLSCANQVISNDSGLMHIAAALNVPLVALYGSTSADFTPPLSRDAVILQTDVSCRPCFKRTCPLQHHACMQQLTPEKALQALRAMPTVEVAA